ncbi:C3 and PZP-like alpha-2-macroglobulin domain-containing protein 8 isoform X1 [Prionailurus iriomotensis]
MFTERPEPHAAEMAAGTTLRQDSSALTNWGAVGGSTPAPPPPHCRYLIKVEEDSASSHLVPLQREMLVREQLARKPEVRVHPAPVPSACFLPSLCGAYAGQWEVGQFRKEAEAPEAGGLPMVVRQVAMDRAQGMEVSVTREPRRRYPELPPSLPFLQPPLIRPQPKATRGAQLGPATCFYLIYNM